MSITSNPATFSKPDRTWLGIRYMRSNSFHGRFPLSDSPLVFEFSLTNLPSLAQTRDRDKCASIIHPTNLALSVQEPNPVLQPRELLRLGHNIGSFQSPFFRGRDHCHDLQETFHIPLHPSIRLGWNIGMPRHEGARVNSIEICHLLLA
jgi:hypothetical protein